MFLHKNVNCDPSLEPSGGEDSVEGSQHMVLVRNKKNYPRILLIIPPYSELLGP